MALVVPMCEALSLLCIKSVLNSLWVQTIETMMMWMAFETTRTRREHNIIEYIWCCRMIKNIKAYLSKVSTLFDDFIGVHLSCGVDVVPNVVVVHLREDEVLCLDLQGVELVVLCCIVDEPHVVRHDVYLLGVDVLEYDGRRFRERNRESPLRRSSHRSRLCCPWDCRSKGIEPWWPRNERTISGCQRWKIMFA